jgi:hypothetical protein
MDRAMGIEGGFEIIERSERMSRNPGKQGIFVISSERS